MSDKKKKKREGFWGAYINKRMELSGVMILKIQV